MARRTRGAVVTSSGADLSCVRAAWLVFLLCAVPGFADLSPAFQRAKALEDAGRTAEASAVFEALVAVTSTAPQDRDASLMELSRMALAAGKYSDSISKGQRAAQGFHAVQDFAGEGNALTITGLAHTYEGSYDAALSDFRQALKIAHDAGDAKQEITRLNNIGTMFYFQGRYADALEELGSAMRLVNGSAGQVWSASRRQLTTANIAIIYQSLGQYDRALETYAGLRGASDGLEVQERAQLLANMGALYRRLGDPVKALETYAAARVLYQQRALVSGQIAVLNNIGIAQALDLHQLKAALGSFGEALSLATSSGDKLGGLQTLLYRAQTYYLMGSVRESGLDFGQAAALAQGLHAPEEHWKALYGLARLERGAGGVALLQKAVGLIESLRGAGPVELRGGFLADKRQVYDLLIRELAAAPQPDPAALFRLMELSRSRGLQDRTGPETSLDQLRRRLPAGTLLLEYWLGDDSLLVLHATSTQAGVVFQTALPGLRQRLRAFNQTLTNPASTGWQGEAASVAQALLAGLEPALSNAGVRSLVIVPDRETALVPFDVLPLPGQAGGRVVTRVADRFAVSYLPAAALLQPHPQSRQTVPFWHRTLLALGDPAPQSGSGAFAMPSARDSRRLPAAAEEVRALQGIVGGRTAIYTGAEAAKQNLLRGLELRFPVLHLATHAFADPEDPAHSYILLAGADRKPGYDYLFLNEIRRLDLHGVDLVTLSACETESGKLVEGEGVAGFSSALLGSGARAVVSSLWEVGDKAGARLMESFYGGMASGLPAAEALRRARVSLASGGTAHPFYWSAFVLNGDPDVTLPRVVGWVFPLAEVLGLAGAVLLFRSRRGKMKAS